MKKKYAPPADRDRVPAMFVGDQQAAPAALAPDAREAAAMLPDDLRVVVEGTTTHRVSLIAAGVLAAAVFALGIFRNVLPPPGVPFYPVLLGAGGLLLTLGHRLFARHRKEYRLADDGLVVELLHANESRPRVTRIPWTEIEDYSLSVDDRSAKLRVASVRGFSVSLKDRPPRLATREFIRRFVEKAERHPRAVRPGAAVDTVGATGSMSSLAALALVVLGLFGDEIWDALDLPAGHGPAGLVALGVVAWGLRTWKLLNDDDVAYRDRASRRPIARLRSWLRRVLGIRVV
ncbi:MAG: hypothetical protein KY467_08490 [Gemmatimonadetes bacterium]|nr:hypothetical protein [Gemmatimonadota bacterium]